MDFLATPELWIVCQNPPPALTINCPTIGQLLTYGRRSLAFTGAIALLLGTSTSLQADDFSPVGTAYVATPSGYNLNIRSGSGTQYPAVNTLRPGTTLSLSGRYQNGWAQLADGNWVAGNLIRTAINNRAAPIPSNIAYIATPEGYHLNIRSGPGTQYAAVNTLRRGTAITLTGRYQNGWAQLADGTWAAGNWLWRDRPSPSGGSNPGNGTTTAPNATVPNIPTDDGLLRLGDQGETVVQMQGRLRSLGYLPDDFVATGIFDARTEQAVIEFQRTHDLPHGGIVGPQMLEILYSGAAIYKPSPSEVGAPSDLGGSSGSSAGTGANDSGTTPPTEPDSTESNAGQSTNPGQSNTEPTNTEPTSPAGGGTATVNTYGMEMPVFSGPGTQYDYVGDIPDGTVLTLTGRSESGWVELTDGTWAYAAVLAF